MGVLRLIWCKKGGIAVHTKALQLVSPAGSTYLQVYGLELTMSPIDDGRAGGFVTNVTVRL